MQEKQKNILLLIFFIIIFIWLNYSFLDKFLLEKLVDYEVVKIDRVIDGDTIVVNETSYRLLGINSPERGEKYYSEAQEFLEDLVLNRDVGIKYGKEKQDKYGRELVYVFIGVQNVNLKLVEEGFANYYFPSGKDEYYNEFRRGWENCVEKNINLCEKSEDVCVDCIKLKEFNSANDFVVFENVCDFDCDLNAWEIKDEGRKKFLFENFVLGSRKEVGVVVGENCTNDENILCWVRSDYVWTDTGDTLFLRDSEGKLVLWGSY